MVILVCDQDTDSYLLAVDRVTGKIRWKTPRPDSTRGYATPALYQPKNGPAELIVPGAFQVVSYSLSTGERLWWIRGTAWQLKSVPVIDGDVIYVSGWETGGDTDPPEVLTWQQALEKYVTNQEGKVTVLKAAAQWEILAINDLDDEVFATPAIDRGRIYLRTRGTLYCFAGL